MICDAMNPRLGIPGPRWATTALWVMVMGLLLVGTWAAADVVTQTQSDAADQSALVEGQHWGAGVPGGAPPAGTAPTAGYDYVNDQQDSLTRTPTSGDVTFAGRSLTIANGAWLELLNPAATTTITDLRLNGGIVDADASLGATTVRLAGAVALAQGGGTFQAADSSTVLAIDAALVDPAAGTPGGVTFGGTGLEGTIVLTNGASTYTGSTLISSGVVEVQSGHALGAPAVGTTVAGTGALWLTGDIAVPEALNLLGRDIDRTLQDPTKRPQVISQGDNTLAGPIGLSSGPDPAFNQFGLVSLGGTLKVTGGVTADTSATQAILGVGGPGDVLVQGDISIALSAPAAQARVLALGPATTTIDGKVTLTHTGVGSFAALDVYGGDLIVNGKVDMANSVGNSSMANWGSGRLQIHGDIDMSPINTDDYHDVFNAGSGSTLIAGGVAGVDALGAYSGTLVVGAAADISSVHWLDLDGGGIIDASGVVGGFSVLAGQEVTAWGDGTLRGDVILESGGLFRLGRYSPADLTVEGSLTMRAGSMLSVMIDPTDTGAISLLEVTGTLLLDSEVLLTFNWDQIPDDGTYVFARWGQWAGAGRFTPVGLPTGYEVYYDDAEHLAGLVWVPAPAPLFLIVLGALVLAGRRRASPDDRRGAGASVWW
ncbi:hypothetical protein [Candidatus Thiodictyon syntrophicum]|jgi:autotransporter-associated beta strand protein|uniref:Uncharacterized protein n=1 Tax=Candidatus Thiodictyon syntrophicum TaxID=1166950 RepID=A0A2K8UAY9_9GAMM|nr:hypothetical protein [Candidatus Thiodictyon syntrophicum]AUB82744.1 hypothetical protein THSYN_18575 [Candidatus Thiodictyon syntrophicum]